MAAQIRTVQLDAASIVRRTKANDAGEETVDPNAPIQFNGHAAVFDQPTLIGSRQWGFVEWIEKGAFSDVLNDDVRFLFNHDGMPLARTTNGTLKLSEDSTGLVAEADLAPVTMSRDLATLIERGDLSQMSFAFMPGQERVGTIDMSDPKAAGHAGMDLPDEYDGLPYSVVTKMQGLFDVSAVTYPAYEGTDATIASARQRADSVRGKITVARHNPAAIHAWASARARLSARALKEG